MHIPYSGKFSLVQNFVEMRPDSSEEILRLLFLWNRCVTLWPHPYQLTATHTCKVKEQDKERQSEEASLYNNGPVFLLCGALCSYKSIKTAATSKKLACWDSTLLISTSTTSERLLAFCMVAGWFCFIVTIYRQTDCREPSPPQGTS